ncbi:DoxX family protein [Streptomyces sp. NPDC089919]|uniref:DoxX family protein n=1 Tax=Streptomyces sp. NPDC089919 TaxID=3155188 RepID=UPI00341CA405
MTALTAPLIAVVFLPLGAAKLAAVPVMREAAAHLGMTPGHYRLIGGLEVAGVAGVLTGPAWPPAGAAAGAGLAALMAGAAVAHRRAGDPWVRTLPALACGALALVHALRAL